MIVCLCNRVTDRQVRAQLAKGDRTIASVHRSLGVSPKCCKCLPTMRDIVRESGQSSAAALAV